MPFCRTHQTIVQVVQEIHVFVHNNTGLVNGWCVSINRMIKVFPGPPLHVCYVWVCLVQGLKWVGLGRTHFHSCLV